MMFYVDLHVKLSTSTNTQMPKIQILVEMLIKLVMTAAIKKIAVLLCIKKETRSTGYIVQSS